MTKASINPPNTHVCECGCCLFLQSCDRVNSEIIHECLANIKLTANITLVKLSALEVLVKVIQVVSWSLFSVCVREWVILTYLIFHTFLHTRTWIAHTHTGETGLDMHTHTWKAHTHTNRKMLLQTGKMKCSYTQVKRVCAHIKCALRCFFNFAHTYMLSVYMPQL